MANEITVKELRRKSPQELEKMSQDLREQMRVLRFEIRAGQQRKVHQVEQMRRSIAKVLTISNEMKKK
jgi:large subunit ribosomal protein L29